MNKKTFIIIPSKGLGDLMVCLGLAFNLSKEFNVKIYHPLIKQLSKFIPYVECLDRPSDFSSIIQSNTERCILIYEDSTFFEAIYPFLKEQLREKLSVLNPVVTEKRDYKFVDDYFFNPKLSFSENLLIFAKGLFLKNPVSNISGINFSEKKDNRLILLHATCSKESKSWPKQRFIDLKTSLETAGYKVMFATLPYEKIAIEQGLYSGILSLEDLAGHIAKASLVIGNESGVCHLASALNTDCIALCRSRRIVRFWGPDYEGSFNPIFPPAWVPNIKNFRIRDKFWRYFIFTRAVYKKAIKLLEY